MNINLLISQQKLRDRFSKNLRYWLELRNITQKELSEITGLSVVSINRYATGKSLPNGFHVSKISKALRCSSDDLLLHD